MKKIFTLHFIIGFFLLFFPKYIIAGNAKSPSLSLVANVDSNNYAAKTVIFKLKSDQAVSNKKDPSGSLDAIFSSVQKKSLKKKFPKANIPMKDKNAHGEKLIDLSLIYELTYDANESVESVINKLLADKNVLYAEPKYINKPLYTPNDPSVGSQYYLNLVKILQAWDISKGDTNIVIGITDTGFDLTHLDLKDNIKYNYNDPIDGIDNDGDTYIDNFRGWDLGNNDNDPSVDGVDHGVYVSGLAAASTDNAIGIAGSGFKCKFLPIKIESGGQLINEFNGIVYAAEHGCQIINCSWGHVGGGSQFEQDIVNYATINHNCLVVAAAGNDNNEGVYYPASYNNVISVAASDASDKHGVWGSGIKGSNYGYNIDVCAPGVGVFTTQNGNGYYSSANGTSFASPIAAGCAAIIKSKFPSYTGIQVGERLRATCDFIDTVNGNAAFIGKLGRGRINLFRALTEVTPSIRTSNFTYTDGKGNKLLVGDTMKLWGAIKNYLDPASNLTVTLTSDSPYLTILAGALNIGALNTFDSIVNNNNPFRIKINPNTPLFSTVVVKLTYTDGNYIDYQYLSFVVNQNPNYIDMSVNNISTTITGVGRIGYSQPGQQFGLGFQYNKSTTILYAGGLVLSSGVKIEDNVYGAAANSTDNDFLAVSVLKAIVPSVVSDEDLEGKFNDSLAGANRIGVLITHKAFAWKSVLDSNYVIVEYTIKNTNASKIDSLYAGLYLDWDIDNANQNRANFDSTLKMGYTNSTKSSPLYGGAKLLTEGGIHSYAIDNPGNFGNVNIYDGFSSAEKDLAIKNNRFMAGINGLGNDVSSLVSTGPFMLASGDSVKVAFALVSGKSLTVINDAAVAADIKYNTPKISANKALVICEGDSIILTSSFAKSYKWSNGKTTRSITIKSSGTYSVKVPGSINNELTSDLITINVSIPQSTITAGGPLTFCQGSSVILTCTNASTYLWSNGAATQSIKVSSAGLYSVTAKNATGCSASSAVIAITVNSLPASTITVTGSTNFCQGDSVKLTASAGSGYKWSNGSLTQIIFASASANYTVTVTDANGCFAASAATVVTVKNAPTAKITANSSTTFCAGGNVSLISTLGNSYNWSSGEKSQGVSVSASGNYTVTVKGANGCSAVSPVTTITVMPVPIATITSSGSTTICTNDTIVLTASSGGSYVWSSGPLTQSIKVFNTGNYSVTVVGINGCSSLSNTIQVTLNPSPLKPSISQTSNILTSSIAAIGYQWFLNNALIPGAILDNFQMTKNGIYKVQITNSKGCSTISDLWNVLNLGIDDGYPEIFSLHQNIPNPSGTSTTISFDIVQKSTIDLTIYNLMGQKTVNVCSGDFPAGSYKYTIDLSGFAEGIYYYQLSAQGKSITKKLMVYKQ